MTRALRGMSARVPPPGLTTSLRVLASRERQRASQRRSLQLFYQAWMERLRLSVHNLMRPLAVPFAGGVFSAVALFAIWVVPTYPLRAHAESHMHDSVDVPTALSTVARVKEVSFVGNTKPDVVVEIVIDNQGRMVDYRIVEGSLLLADAPLRRNLENWLMFTAFEPATSFGMPMRGTLRLYFSSGRQIEVKG